MRLPTGPAGYGAGRRMHVLERRVPVGGGVRLRIEERNREAGGVPLLLVHGFTGSVEAWGESLLDALGAERWVVAVDLPGHGGSDVPEEVERYRMEAVVRDLEVVLDAVEAGRAVWVGYSMGGRVALGAAVTVPERVAALVLESASPGLETDEERRLRRESDRALADRIDEFGLETFVDEWMDKPLFESWSELDEHTLLQERQRRLAGHPSGLSRTLRGLGTGSQPSFWERLGGVTAPALVLTGGRDEKFEAIGDRMAAKLPDADRRSIPEAGHAVYLERPGSWIATVLDFLEKRGL